ncbi:MAG: asparagine synthase (glutamine-hydrolyzing) [Gammaproteobacteria bacterium]|nr:asparagine synthase (glutamine-hydrolyzing) [Gammaproteobacteria bacterium]
MCGLTFTYQADRDSDTLLRRTNRAIEKIVHRGPDEMDIWSEGSAVLGHRRLSIIDPGDSHQPMMDPSGRYVLGFNGAIYNYKELKKEFEGKWAFRTGGDTEVVLAALALHGESFFSRMEGMWSIAFWDKQRGVLLLSRDRMGKKPLYYQQTANGINCASELPALRLLSEGSWDEDLDGTADYLRYGFYLPGKTAYHGIQEVLPGHTLQWVKDGSLRQTPYWSIDFNPAVSTSPKKINQALRETVISAVEKRLVADVEVGAFLSGGIDSSLVVAIVNEVFAKKTKTFTMGFSDSSFDETEYARQVATRFKTDHFEESLVDWDRSHLVKLLQDHVGQPFADPSLLPTSNVSRLAGQHVKVVLSGDGGDELFCGYQRYQARAILRWYTRLPGLLRAPLESVIKLLPEPMSHHSRSLLKKAHLFVNSARRFRSNPHYVAPEFYSSALFSQLAPDLSGMGHDMPPPPEEAGSDALKTMMAQDLLVYLPQDILVKVDRASMAWSVEARAPFLDSNVVRFAMSLPMQLQRNAFSGKLALRSAFSDLLPDSILRRRKQGFGVPVHEWFTGELGGELLELLTDGECVLNRSFIENMLKEHRKGIYDYGYHLWAIYVYLMWLRHGVWREY